MKIRVTFFALIASVFLAGQQSIADESSQVRELVNSGTVGIIGGDRTSTDLRLATDLSDAFDDGYQLRVIATVGKGSLRNIEDLLFLKGIDIAICQSDVLEFYKRNNVIPDIEERISYIAKLFNEEFHILARDDIRSVEDLKGRRVNLGSSYSGTFMTANIVFDDLDIEVQPTGYSTSVALQKLRDGEIDAMVRMAGKPLGLFTEIDPNEPFHFLPVSSDRIQGDYLPGELTSDDYPNLIAPGDVIDAVAVGEIMAAYNWPEGHPRGRKVETFVQNFFGDFDRLLDPAFHPKWNKVDLTVDLPGWQRLPVAESMVARKQAAVTN
ncbi:MAG: TAXI family TRAP transporter solute-binding subunit [Geminicoccaceae bacterium]